MTSNEKYQHLIIPELQNFWSEHREDYINSGLVDGLMLPYTYEGYDSCTKKIFYIGQDPPYWLSKQCMTTLFDKNKYMQYLHINNEVMHPLEKRFAWGNSTSFWTMIVKTHLYILTNKWYGDINHISSADKVLLDTMGYGNVHFIPLPQTIHWYSGAKINESSYKVVDDALKSFNYLQIIVENFEPDTIVLLGVAFDKKRYFAGLNIRWSEPSNLISVGEYEYKNKMIKLLWVYNPNYYRFAGTNMHKVANLIKSFS